VREIGRPSVAGARRRTAKTGRWRLGGERRGRGSGTDADRGPREQSEGGRACEGEGDERLNESLDRIRVVFVN